MNSYENRADLTLNETEFFNRYNRKKTVGTSTLGCRVNQYETEAMVEKFIKEGYENVDFDSTADVYVKYVYCYEYGR